MTQQAEVTWAYVKGNKLPLGKLGKKAKLEAKAKAAEAAAGGAGAAAGAGAAEKARSEGESVRRRNELLAGLQRVVCEKNLNICPAGVTLPPGGAQPGVEDLIKKSGNKRGCVYAHKGWWTYEAGAYPRPLFSST